MAKMEARASIPLTLPRPNPTVSYWQDPPDPKVADHLHALAINGNEIVDTVVVGSGITGSCIAWNLLNERKNNGAVAMLEARQACSGATGRNGGHTKAGSYRSFLNDAAEFGVAEAVKITRLEYTNIKSLQAFAREHGLQCDQLECDTVDVMYDRVQWKAALTAIEEMRKAMPEDLNGAARYHIWTPEEAREKFHVKGEECYGAVSYEAGSLSAYKFVVGVLMMSLELGLQLYTNTPALALEKGANGTWSVKTDRGVLRAKRVVMATNGYTGYLCDRFHKVIVPLRGQITAHRPGKSMPVQGLPTTYSFIYANGYEYMIPRPQNTTFAGDIIMGGGLVMAPEEGLDEFGTTDDTTVNPIISKYLAETTPRYFGEAWGQDHPKGRIRREWTGIMGYSSDGFPFVGEVPGQDGLWVAASFQGHGMVLCFMCAKALVVMMAGEDEKLDTWFPSVFRVTDDRLKKRFMGRLHTMPTDIETTHNL